MIAALCLVALTPSWGAEVTGSVPGPAFTDFTFTVPQQVGSWSSITVNMAGQWQSQVECENEDAANTRSGVSCTKHRTFQWLYNGTALGAPTSDFLESTTGVRLHAYDGTTDYTGLSGYTQHLDTNFDRTLVFTDPAILAAFTGTGTVTLTVHAYCSDQHSPTSLMSWNNDNALKSDISVIWN